MTIGVAVNHRFVPALRRYAWVWSVHLSELLPPIVGHSDERDGAYRCVGHLLNAYREKMRDFDAYLLFGRCQQDRTVRGAEDTSVDWGEHRPKE